MKLTLAYLLILVMVVFSACAQPAEAPPPATPPPATSPEEAAAPSAPPPATSPEEAAEVPPPATITQEDVEAARQAVFAYWEAFNNYDVEGVLAFLEESYRQEREESLTSEIGQMKAFHKTIGVEEEAEPVIIPEGKVEIKMKLATPLGTKHYTYQMGKINGDWKIYLAVEE